MARKKTPDVMGELLGGKAVDPKSAERKTDAANAPSAKTAATKMAEPAKVASVVKEEPPEEEIPEAVNAGDHYEVQRIIDRYALWAAGIGLVPMPFVALVVLSR